MNLLQKILGITNQDVKLEKIENTLDKLSHELLPKSIENDFKIVDPLDIHKVHFSFEVTDVNIPNKKEISTNSVEILQIIGQSMPNLISNGLLAKSYRFVFPSGISGQVMQIGNGQGTAIIQGGKIIQHGTYVSNLLFAAPLVVYNISAIIIQQHYLAKINANLNQINQKVSHLLELEFIKKHAKIESIIYFLENAQNDFSSIKNNKEYRIAILQNLVRVNVEIFELIQFYKKSLKFIEPTKTNENELNLKYFLALHSLFYQGKLLEFKYAAEYNEDLINSFISSIEKLTEETTAYLNSNKDQINDEIKNISTGFKEWIKLRKKKNQELKSNLSNTKLVVDDLIEFQKYESETITNSLNQLYLEMSRRHEFLIEDGVLYEVIQENI